MSQIVVVKHDYVMETKLRDGDNEIEVVILNVYGPFYNQNFFWENFGSSGVMGQENVILEGDLNLTLSMGEVSGENTMKDFLSSFFMDFFKKKEIGECNSFKNGTNLEK